MKSKISIYVSHPNFDNSIFNKHLAQEAKKNDFFSVFSLDKKMENGRFNLEEEIQILRNSKALVWQFPIYWYNCPSSLRDWQDQILSPIVYGNDNFLKGKPIMVAFTAGAGKENYCNQGLNRYTIDEMLRPFEMTANASGMVWQQPLGFFNCNPNMPKATLEKMTLEYISRLKELDTAISA